MSLTAAIALAASPSIAQLETTWQVLNVADFVTTEICLRHRDHCEEKNPIYGKNPSTVRLAGTKIAAGVLHKVLSDELEKRDPKLARIFQYVTITMQGGVVVSNLRFVF